MTRAFGKNFFLFFLLSNFILNATSSSDLEDAFNHLDDLSLFCHLKNCMLENVDCEDFTEEDKRFLNEEINDYKFIMLKAANCRLNLEKIYESLPQEEPSCLISDNYDDMDVKIKFRSFNKLKTGCEWLVKGSSVIWALKIIYDLVL